MADYGQQKHQATDAYGNPVAQTGTQAYGGSTGTGKHGTGAHDQSQLCRSGSSSSSEDDGMGGRRKKGIKEKIKEKLPGAGHKKEGEQPREGGGYGSAAAGGEQQHVHEKKGIMEKIGVGHNKEGEQPYGGGGGYGSVAAGEEQQHGHEKKGMVEKIKEKLPGGGGGAGHHE